MSKVYIVVYHAYVGESWVDVVFGTRESADEYVAYWQELHPDSRYEIIEEEVL